MMLDLGVARILLLGSTGMLGSEMGRQALNSNNEVFLTSRRIGGGSAASNYYLDAEKATLEDLQLLIEEVRPDYVINCIGVIKQLANETHILDRLRLIKVNAEFPHLIAQAIEGTQIKLIQIATDCVYSGREGRYSENSAHNPVDLYGKTKSIGEVASPNILHLRSSIIGREIGSSASLLEWVITKPLNETINGYVNHFWNGVTTHAFSKIVLSIIRTGSEVDGTLHLVPSNVLSKFELVSHIATSFGRSDLEITPFNAECSVDRTLSTLNSQLCNELWLGAGYSSPPTIEFLLDELSVLPH